MRQDIMSIHRSSGMMDFMIPTGIIRQFLSALGIVRTMAGISIQDDSIKPSQIDKIYRSRYSCTVA
jgi:hypothetical protein